MVSIATTVKIVYMPEQQNWLYMYKLCLCLSIYLDEFNLANLQNKDMTALFRELFDIVDKVGQVIFSSAQISVLDMKALAQIIF